MPKTYSKVVFQPDTKSTDSFEVIVNPEQYKKWKDGDTTIPLIEVVDAMKVFHSSQGAQGIMRPPSNQHLEAVFHTHNVDDCVKRILELGTMQTGTHKPGYSTTNDGKLGANQTSMGSGGGFGGR